MELVTYDTESDTDTSSSEYGEDTYSRRDVLRGAGAVGAATLSGDLAVQGTAESDESYDPAADMNSEAAAYPERAAVEDLADVPDTWGAVYSPADAYNSWQMWGEYDEEVIERDLGYAADANLDSVRVLLSFEYWHDNPEGFEERFDHFLETADGYGIDVLPVLYESIGADPEKVEDLGNENVKTAFAVHTPSKSKWIDNGSWNNGERCPETFTRRFTEMYGSEDAVMAVEIMNEPTKWDFYGFADSMVSAARDANPDATLTMGCRKLEFNNLYNGLDVHQVHYNLPPKEEDMDQQLQQAEQHRKQSGKPVWLTEWQRTRQPAPPQDDFPDDQSDYPQKMLPNYESLAPQLQNAVDTGKIDGAFLWDLMVTPAYIKDPRESGRINGLFHEDGSVWDLDDVRAVSGDPDYLPPNAEEPERQELPDGMEQFVQSSG